MKPLKSVGRIVAMLVPFILSASLPTLTQAAAPGLPEIGMPFGNHFAAMKAKLNLNPAQDAQYSVASQATIKAIEAARNARSASAAIAKAELAKADPDFGRILMLREEAQAATASERRTAISEWVKFTQLLSTEQKALIKGQLLDRVSRADKLREKFRQRHGG